MAKRATLYDMDNREVAHLRYAEIDDLFNRGLVERLTPVRSSIHHFRLLVTTTAPSHQRTSPSSLTAAINLANAGACDNLGTIFWARRKVRVWLKIGDLKAPLARRRVQPYKVKECISTMA